MCNKRCSVPIVGFLLWLVATGWLSAQTTSWRLIWDKNPETDMYYYEIYRQVNGDPYAKIAVVYHPDTVYVDDTIQKGVRYAYRIKAVDSSYNKSDFSPEVQAAIPQISGLPQSLVLPPDTTVTMDLDNYVNDPDHPDDQLVWSASGTNQLSILLDDNTHVLTIQTSATWRGTETLRLQVTDPDGFTDVWNIAISSPVIDTSPVISDIPDQQIQEGGSFSSISLNDYVTDPDHSDAELSWTVSGNQDLRININQNHVATIEVPDTNWFGQETVVFRVMDPDSQFAEDTVRFIVTPVNDRPVVADIPDQFIEEGETFTPILLDDFVKDVDNTDDEITWTVQDAQYVQITIDAQRVAHIEPVDSTWGGMDTVFFVARDPAGLEDRDAVIFGISVRMPPSIAPIPRQVIDEGESFPPILLDDYVTDADNAPSELSWSYRDADWVRVLIGSDRVAHVSPLDSNWFGQDTVIFQVTDPDGQSDDRSVVFVVNPVNDPPQVSNIPNQNIRPGERFEPIPLNNYVKDVDHPLSAISWSVYGADSLVVVIDDNNVANIYFVKSNWIGADTIIFRATDAAGAWNEDEVILRVVSFNTPLLTDIPDQIIDEGQQFAPIPLDDYVDDGDDADAEIQWSVSGKKYLDVSISDDRVATIILPDSNWYGRETLTFRAMDPDGNWATDEVTFVVRPVNDPPVIAEIPDQVIRRGETFQAIYLDEYVQDVDNDIAELVWTIRGYRDLSVILRSDRVVFVEPPGIHWYGSEVLTFRATDPEGLFDEVSVRFTVENVADDFFPTVSQQYYGSGQNVLIRWMTNEPTRDYLEYGLDASYGQQTSPDSVFTTEHQALLTDLEPNQTYYYRIVSQTVTGELIFSEQKTFTTGEVEGVNVFPIPFQAGGDANHQAIHFVNLPIGGVLNIYNLLGELVYNRKIDSRIYRWNVKNSAGKSVLSGLYIYVVRDSENNKVASGKLIIVR
ncbi:MAG: hypothetical protein GXO78_02840 [Calditrichaeota bacterium]|nr:hypothetical protein [Calditrichota bacterium]